MIKQLLLQISLVPAVAQAPLRVGDVMPRLSGQTVSGKPIELPVADMGTVRVLVFSFSRSARSDSQLWSEHVAKEASAANPVIAFRVIMLESVPRLFRGTAQSGIRGSVPQPLWDRTILSYVDEETWKKKLAASSEKHAYVIVLDGKNRVRWLSSELLYGQSMQP